MILLRKTISVEFSLGLSKLIFKYIFESYHQLKPDIIIKDLNEKMNDNPLNEITFV